MTFRRVNVPADWRTKAQDTRDDLQRVRRVLENLGSQMDDLQTQITENAANAVTGPAEELATTGAAVNVGDAAPPTAGQVLTAVDATHSAWQDPDPGDEVSNFWARPTTAHLADEEFDSTTLPTAMKLYDLSTVPATLVSPTNSGISVFDATGPAAGACRIESHMTGKRSWVCIQPRSENRFWFYGKQIVLPAASSGFVTKSRFHIPTRWLGPSVDNTAHMMFTIMTDDGSNRPLSSASAATKVDTGIQAGWEVDVTAANLKVFLKTGGVTSGLVTSGVSYINAATADFEISFVKTPAADTAWHVFFHTPSISSFVTTSAYTFVAHATTVWVGWVFNGANNDAPGAPVVRGDYLRFLDTATGFVL